MNEKNFTGKSVHLIMTLTTILLLAMCILVMPAETRADKPGLVANGMTGDSVAWYLTDDGILTLAGTGDTWDYASDNLYFAYYSEQITSVVVGEGITGLGDCIFAFCDNIETISLPSTLKSIGNFALYYCVSLKSVDIPDSVTEIGSYAFYECESLESLRLSEKLGSIPKGAFMYCVGLSSAGIPASVRSIGESAFEECNSLFTLSFAAGSTLSSIGKCAFNNCLGLSQLELPEGLKQIGEEAFSGCGFLQSVSLPESLLVIDEGAFSGCSSLTQVSIPAGVVYIGDGAFAECYCIGAFDVAAANGVYCSSNGIIFSKDMTVLCAVPADFSGTEGVYAVPDTVTEIAGLAFSCSLLTEIKLPSSLRTIGEEAFSLCTGLTEMVIPEGVSSLVNAIPYCYNLRKLTLPSTMIYISEGSFINCYEFAEFDVAGDNPCYVDMDGVLYSSDMTTLCCYPQAREGGRYEIPDTVAIIDRYAFSYCSGLNEIIIPENVTYIGAYAFAYCTQLTSAVLPEGLTELCQGIFCGCSSLADIVIPESVTSIGTAAFEDCSSLESLELPLGLDSLGTEAFANCSSLRSVDIPYGITEIGDYTFFECYALESVSLPEGITTIGSNAFMNCSTLSELWLPDSVTEIGEETFKFCTSLEYINIPEGVTSIPGQTFSSCSSLQQLVLPEGVCSVDAWAFEDCTSLGSVALPSTLEYLDEDAFSLCTGISRLEAACPGSVIPDSLLDNMVTEEGIVFTDDVGLSARAREAGLKTYGYGEWDHTYTAGRIAGSDRYETGSYIAGEYGLSDAVILASGENFADAMAGISLSAALNAPIIMTGRDALPSSSMDAIVATGATKIYILGGTSAISLAVETGLRAEGYKVKRVAGENRSETAVKIAGEEAAIWGAPQAIFVVSGAGYADALSIGPVAGLLQAPVLYSNPETGLDENTLDFIADNPQAEVVIIGGTAAVPGIVEAQLTGSFVSRIYGEDRYETSMAIVSEYSYLFMGGTAYICSGAGFADGLAVGALAVRNTAPVLICGTGMPEEKLAELLENLCISDIFIIGGTGAVSDELETDIMTAYDGLLAG